MPEVHLAPGTSSGARASGGEDQPHWKNLNPRSALPTTCSAPARRPSRRRSAATTGAAVDDDEPGGGRASRRSTNRTWNDARTGNFVPDCDLLEPQRQRRVRRLVGPHVRAEPDTTRNAPDAISGFNRQDHNWQASASVQHELRPGIGVNLGYFRTLVRRIPDGRRPGRDTRRADFDEYCITAPTDPRLPHSGERLCGLYDLKPAKFGLVDNLVTQQSNFGDHTRVYNGVDATMSARFAGRAGLGWSEHRAHR